MFFEDQLVTHNPEPTPCNLQPVTLKMNTRFVIDVIGWAGAAALLAAYGLVSAKRLDGDSMTFQLLNLVGAIFLIINTAYYGAYPCSPHSIWLAATCFRRNSSACMHHLA